MSFMMSPQNHFRRQRPLRITRLQPVRTTFAAASIPISHFKKSLECMLVGHKPASDVKRATEDIVTGTGGGTELMLHSHIYMGERSCCKPLGA